MIPPHRKLDDVYKGHEGIAARWGGQKERCLGCGDDGWLVVGSRKCPRCYHNTKGVVEQAKVEGKKP